MKMTAQPDQRRTYLIIAIVLAVVTIGVYSRALSGEFLEYDDEQYVTLNQYVLPGFTSEGMAFAFRMDGYAANWHPLTWMSHMLDAQIDRALPYQAKPSAAEIPLPEGARHPWVHHLSNVLLHALATVLLFLALTWMTASPWKSAFVAALFALHPFHVESVAWVAERKDVLSAVFWMLTMLLYARYAERPSFSRYIPVAVAFALGLLAKPMLVTLPFVLLLLDWWPLRRFERDTTLAIVLEKLPLIVLSSISCVITVHVQRMGGALGMTDGLPPIFRTGNALISYFMYVYKTFVPIGFANPYPHPGASISLLSIALATAFLVVVTATAMVLRNKRYLGVGWFWFLGTLIPVIGLVQVGEQAMADRYSYLSLIGVFIMVAWGVPDLFKPKVTETRGREDKPVELRPQLALIVPAVLVIAVLSVLTVIQIGYWHDGVSLFTHTLEIAPEHNTVAHNNLAKGYEKRMRFDKSAEHYQAVVDARPQWPEGHNNLAYSLDKLDRPAEAYQEYLEAIRRKEQELEATKGTNAPDSNLAKIHVNLGTMLIHYHRYTEAAEHFRKAVARDAGSFDAHYNLACSLEDTDIDEAMIEYQRAIEIDPTEPRAHNNLGVLLYKKGDYAGAWREVHLCQDSNGVPMPPFLEALRTKMPEPPR